jgi:hypothetical protein
MNDPTAPIGGIAASLGQATGYQAENYYHPKERGIKPLSAAGGLNQIPVYHPVKKPVGTRFQKPIKKFLTY